MTRVRTIVVGTDGSDTATRAVARAAELALESGAVLHIVMAYKPHSVQKIQALRASLPEEFRSSVSADSEAQGTMRRAAEHASKMGVKVETHLATGDPAKVILKTAEDLDADVVVVGNKWIERRIRGSVPSGVNRGADRDVLIVDTTSAQRRRAPEQRPRTASSLAGT